MRKQGVTAKEAARRWGISLDFTYRQLLAGRIAGARKHGKRWVIPVQAVRDYLTTRSRGHK
ncbi:MAG: helix-turn-helix domain-containing protein [Terriglobia bacterium]|jgi:excisionase family DNA binding protein